MWCDAVSDTSIEQGDIFANVSVMIAEEIVGEGGATQAVVKTVSNVSVVVLTQSCDLVESQKPVDNVMVARVYTKVEYINLLGAKFDKGVYENIRKGHTPSLRLANLKTSADGADDVRIINFRETYLLKFKYLRKLSNEQSGRIRLKSPYKEYVSYGYANFVSRIALPILIPDFT